MNSVGICTEKCPTNANPLSALKAVGGRIADSLKTAARSVVSSNAGMFAGLTMLTAASSGTTLATEVVLRDTIRDTPATTQNATWGRGNQTLATQGPTVATFAVNLPANSVCKLSSFSFVFGSMAGMAAPDLFDWREIFNTYNGSRTTDLRVEVFDGPATNLINRMDGDLYSRSISIDEMATTMPWGSTTNTYSGRAVSPYNKATISFPDIQNIETGANGKTIYLKICFVKLQNKSTFGCLAQATGEPANGDISLGGGSRLEVPQSAYAAKVVADISPREITQSVPACGLEIINGKLAVCWPASYGTNYNIGSTTNFTQWAPQEIEGIVTENGKSYAVLKTTGDSSCFFRLESK
jgi:hypothetical protein